MKNMNSFIKFERERDVYILFFNVAYLAYLKQPPYKLCKYKIHIKHKSQQQIYTKVHN